MKEGKSNQKKKKYKRTDFKPKLCSSYICIQSPASSIQEPQTHWQHLGPPWVIPGLCVALSSVSRPHPDLPPHWLSVTRCLTITHRQAEEPLLPPDLQSISALVPHQEVLEMLTSLPGKLLLKTKQSQGTRIIRLGM